MINYCNTMDNQSQNKKTRKRILILAGILFFSIFGLFSVGQGNAQVSAVPIIDQMTYILGETVIIDLSGYPASKLFVMQITKDGPLRTQFAGQGGPLVRYTPKETGTYLLELVNIGSLQVMAVISFEVFPAPEQPVLPPPYVGIISTDKEEYLLGELVTINIDAPRDMGPTSGLNVKVDQRSQSFIGKREGTVSFISRQTGNHTVTLRFMTGHEEIIHFMVIDPSVSPILPDEEPTTPVDPKLPPILEAYLVDRMIVVPLSHIPEQIDRIVIWYANVSYIFLGIPEGDVSFLASLEGTYLIEVMTQSWNLSTSINVSFRAEQPLPPQQGDPTGRDMVITNPEGQTIGIEIEELPSSLRSPPPGGSQAPGQIRRVMRLTMDSGPVRQMTFLNLDLEGSLDLRFGHIKPENINLPHKAVLRSFAIDPSALSFDEGTFTAVASGNELYKCFDFIFSSQTCLSGWEKTRDLEPGKPYTVTFNATDPAYAETGVASINTRRSIYRPGETAEIVMVVLDTSGHLVAGADVTLIVTGPDAVQTTLSTSNGTITMTERGVYEASYTSTSLEGTYEIRVVADGDRVNSSMMSNFLVLQEFDFDIIRDTPVTIDPWLGPFTSSIEIVSFTNASTFNFTEVLPPSFSLGETYDATVILLPNETQLFWEGLTNGSIVSYTALPPLVTPDLYALGPSFVEYGTETFYEARPWYLAIDPAVNYTADSCTQNDDDGGGCTASNLDSADGTNIETLTTDGTTVYLQAFFTPSIPAGATAISAKAFVTYRISNTNQHSNEEIHANTTGPWSQQAGDLGEQGNNNWETYSRDLSDVDTVEEANNIYLRVYDTSVSAGGAKDFDIDLLLVEITYTIDSEPSSVILISPENFTWQTDGTINFTFNATTNDNFKNCTIYTNETSWGPKQVNLTGIVNGSTNGIVHTISADGDYIWNVECSDQSSNTNQSNDNYTIRLDLRDPEIASLDYPGPGATITASKIQFNFTANDTRTLANCTLYLNESGSWQGVATTYSITDNVETNITYSPADGDYVWNVICIDTASRYNTSSSNQTFFLDSVAPVVTLESPENNSAWVSSQTVTFQYNVTDSSALSNCTLYINGALNTTNSTAVQRGTSGQTISIQLDNNPYNWSITCLDANGLSGSSGTFNLTVYYKPAPSIITVTNPANESYTAADPVYLNATTNENSTCKYSTSDGFNYSAAGTLFSKTGNLTHNANLGSLAEDSHTYYIKCNNTYEFINNASNRGMTTFTVDRTYPTVDLNYPSANTNYSLGALNFSWIATDLFIDSSLLCNLTIDGLVNVSSIASPNATLTNHSVDMDNGSHSWNVTCWDDASNTNTSATRSFIIDGDAPEIISASISASPDLASAGTSITIKANVSDAYNGVSSVYVNVTLQTGGTNYFYAMSLATGDQYSYTFTDTSVADTYSYRIWSNDTARPTANIEQSTAKTFTIAGVNGFMSVMTVNDSYKQDRWVNVTSSLMIYTENATAGMLTTYSVGHNPSDKTCSAVFEFNCAGVGPDTFDVCPGGGEDASIRVTEVFLNTTTARYTDTVTITCELDCSKTSDGIYIYYRNSSSGTWRDISQDNDCDVTSIYNESVEFSLDNVAGQHQFRCIIDDNGNDDECSESGGSGGNADNFDNDDINLSVFMVDGDGKTDAVILSGFGTVNYTKLSDLDVYIEIVGFNNTASEAVGNNPPEIEVKMWDGSSYSQNFSCAVDELGSLPVNCTAQIRDADTLAAWRTSDNRLIQVQARGIDYNLGIEDSINWSRVLVELETPSKAENTGALNLSANLLLQIQYLNGSTWQAISTVYNSSFNLTVNQTLDVSSHWNNASWFGNSHKVGTYRTYGALTDATGSILQDENDIYLNDSYLFNISYLQIFVQSPLNQTMVDATAYWANLSLLWTNHPSGGWCGYSLDDSANITMLNDSSSHFYNWTHHTYEGWHNLTFWCNDTDGDTSYAKSRFNAIDQTGPTVLLMSPADDAEEIDGNITFYYNVTDIVSNITNCTFEYNFAQNQHNFSVIEGISQNFSLYDIPDGGPYYWRIFCFDNSSQANRGDSSYRDFIVGLDTDVPKITLHRPIYGLNTTNNDVKFGYRVDDATSNVANCSLIINDRINQTNTTIVEQGAYPYTFNNFTLNDLPDTDYNWSVNCTDASSNANIGNSSTWKFTVERDTDAPIIRLISPEENYTDTDGTLNFQYNVSDVSANIANCSLLINGTINDTTPTPDEDTTLTFTVPDFNEGSYYWQIQCYDDSFDENYNITDALNFSVSIVANMALTVTANSSAYEQGTQLNHTIGITTTTVDTLDNPLNVTVITDIIQGNTSLRWWDTDWQRRTPILLSNPDTSERVNVTIWTNITGLSGYLDDCDELRIVQNDSLIALEVPSSVIAGDDASYCTVIFNANISATVTDQNRFFAYYNNSGVSPLFYTYQFNQSDWRTGSSGSFSPAPQSSFGVFTDSRANNDSYWALGTTSNSIAINSHAYIKYNISGANISEEDVLSLRFNLTYCHSGEDATPDCDGDDPIEGGQAGTQDVMVYNYDTGVWVDIGNLDTNNNENEVNDSYPVTSSVASYINDSSREVWVRYEMNYSTDNSLDSWLVIDLATLTIAYDAQEFTSSIGQKQVHINRSTGPSGDTGSYTISYPSDGLSQTWYSGVSLSTQTSYNNNTNHTRFQIVEDYTDPDVYLTSPSPSSTSLTDNITFIYNVTDALSGITNCSLIINDTINWTNTSITEGQPLNFSVYNLPNSDYSWNVNCTDDSLSNAVGSGTERTFTVFVDRDAPIVRLISPSNGYNDTNGSVHLSYNVTDATSTADCSLYINGSMNATHTDVATDGSTQTFQNINLSDGSYAWYINCTDDSSGAHTNWSASWNFSVQRDTEGPAIQLVTPGDGAHLTNENVTLIYNVSDVIANISTCSLYINGSLNHTNVSIQEDTPQNFTLWRLSGSYLWWVNCTDGSENANWNVSENRTFRVAPDTTGPDINLEFPPNAVELPPGNITFKYNVSDLASAIVSCSLYINGTYNVTNTTVDEDVSQNFTIYLPEADYSWYVNCTDNSPNSNWAISAVNNLTVGIDKTPPQVTLSTPIPGYNDTDGTVLFIYQVYDVASNIDNCSLIINNAINLTNTTVNESVDQNFTLSYLSDGNFSWSVNCTDTAANQGNSSTRNLSITNDNEGPAITLIAPANNTPETDGSRVFNYSVVDAISGIAECRLILNGLVNQTNTSTSEGVNHYFPVSGLNDGTYLWNVTCTDDSDNSNTNSSEMRTLNVTVDNVGPVVSLVDPANNTLETDGNRTFFYTVNDAISNVSSCSLIFNDVIQITNTSISEGVTLNFTKTSMTDGPYNWSVNCTDASENSNVWSSLVRNLTVVLDSAAPVVLLITPANATQWVETNITFVYNVSDTLTVANCSLYLNETLNQTNLTITKDTSLNFTVNNIPNGTYAWKVSCIDLSEGLFRGNSSTYLVYISPDLVGPNVTLLSPPDGIESTTGDITFEYNVTDFASGIKNCSLYFDGALNQTNTSPTDGAVNTFQIDGLANDNYTWFVSCFDDSGRENQGNSTVYNLTIGEDLTAPTITIVSPKNNTYVNSDELVVQYQVTDYGSNISNCTLYLNQQYNDTMFNVTEETTVQFQAKTLEDGPYNYSIYCTDNSNNSNVGWTGTINITVFAPRPLMVNLDLDANTYEQGETSLVTINVTNSSSSPFDASFISDIIRGNTTVPFWDSDWTYRIPVDINATNLTRTWHLVELDLNFTAIFTDEIGNSSLSLDHNSLRVIEWSSNISIEVPSQIENGSGYSGSSNARVTVRWLMNGTTSQQTIRNYFVYFDAQENGLKDKPSYTGKTAALDLTGSSTSVTLDGSSTSADTITLSYDNESFLLSLIDGQDITNQRNIDYQGAGAIYDITINGTRITNLYDSIVPMAIFDNYWLQANTTVIVESGPVVTKVKLSGRTNASATGSINLTYLIWFTGEEIRVRADLLADFASDNNGPTTYFNNLWFAYLFDYSSDWSNYLSSMNSTSFAHIHQWHQPLAEADTANQFNTGDRYSEFKSGLGSISLVLSNASLKDIDKTVGVISLDDFYNPAISKTIESDGAGFNLDQDTTIAASDNYNLRVWMAFSDDGTPNRSYALQDDVGSPVLTTKKSAQTLVNRTSGSSGIDGWFTYNWSTANIDAGWYAAVAFVNKTLYLNGVDNYSFQITIDQTPPTVIAYTPTGWNNSQTIPFLYTPTDSNIINNCSLIINDRLNLTNTTITASQNNTITIGLPAGHFNWSMNCTDAAGNIGNSSTVPLYLDHGLPTVSSLYPDPGDLFNITIVGFNFTVTDDWDTNLSCDLNLDGKVNKTVFAENGTLVNLTVLNLTQAIHTWNVSCTDDAGNTNSSATRTFTVDLGPPTVTLISPSDGGFDNDGTVLFVYTSFDLGGADNCSLIFDNAINQTNTSIINDENNNFTLSGIKEGRHTWTVNCTDSSGAVGTASPYDLVVDLVEPNINLTSPENDSTSTLSYLDLNFTAVDVYGDTMLCNLTLNGTVQNSGYITALNDTETNYSATGLTDGTFFWNVTCLDNASNQNTSVTQTFHVQEPPRISLNSPVDLYQTKSRNNTFYYIPSDNSGQLSNCSIILNAVINITNTSTITVDEQHNFTVRDMQDNRWNWTVNCTDPSGNTGTNTSGRVLYVDNLGPAIQHHNPGDGQAFNDDDITFNWTATDTVLFNMTCNLTIDGVVNLSNLTSQSGYYNTATVENFTLGTHTWNVTCWDALNNTNTSKTQTFIINVPDITISTSKIAFNTTTTREGASVLITANISNGGGISAGWFAVRFYDGDPNDGGTFITPERNVTDLAVGDNVTVNVTWTARLDLHMIWVITDWYNNITEVSKDNNNASKNITIDVWHYTVGNVTGNLDLEDTDANIAYAWQVLNATGTNIYAVDTDSSISWNALYGLGFNTSNASQIDDFAELDDALDMENFTLTINSTYTIDGGVRDQERYFVFSRNLTNVSVANSTNTTDFLTGILWDSSDGGDSDYDGTEDVVFVTNSGGAKTGTYGFYEFEIRIPARLREYLKPNNENSITIYLELQ